MHEQVVRKLLEKPEYYKYLKENSEWVKVLKRNPKKYNDFVKFIKEKYKLRAQDKFSNAVNHMNVLSEVLSSLK